METPNAVEIRSLVRRIALTAALTGALALPSAAATLEVTGQLQADHSTVFVGSTTWYGMQNPGLSQENQGVIYFDTSTYHFYASESGGAYFPLNSAASTQTFSGEATFTNSVTVQNSSITLTGITANVGVFINPGAPGAVEVTTAGFVGNGSGLTDLNASDVTTGTLGAATGVSINLGNINFIGTLPSTVFTGAAALQAGTNTFTGSNTWEGSNVFVSSVAVNNALGVSSETIVNTLTVGEGVTASSFTGNGSALTDLSASQLLIGTVPDARLDSSSVTLQGNTFNGPNQLVLLNTEGELPSSVFTGSAALLKSTQTFSGEDSFANSVTLLNSSITLSGANAGIFMGGTSITGTALTASSATVTGQTLLATQGGNVGIGTTAPRTNFVVNSTSEFDVNTTNNYVSLQIGGVEVARIKP